MRALLLEKMVRTASRKADALAGRVIPLAPTLAAMALRPFELHLELTNICNANCIFCPYQFQERAHATMPDEVFHKAVADYVAEAGGSVFFTPIVGDALIDPKIIERISYVRSQPGIDRIKMITNAILVERIGARTLIESGISTLAISIAGFEREMYERVYRSKQYPRVLRNVLALLRENEALGRPVNLVISLRPDRPLAEVMAHKDFQEVLTYNPELDFTWSFSTAHGRITREMLSPSMRLRSLPRKKEACVNTYNGPMILPNGDVLICSCIAAMDAGHDLSIGNLKEHSLGDIWRSHEARQLRASFGTDGLNATCRGCDAYRGLELYRTGEGRERARINRQRADGVTVKRAQERGVYAGG